MGDRRVESYVQINIGRAYEDLKDHERARSAYSRALALSEETKDKHGQSRALGCLAFLDFSTGNLNASAETGQRALTLIRSVGDRRGEAAILNTIGLVKAASGELDIALERFGDALSIFRAAADRNGEAATLLHIAHAQRDQGTLHAASNSLKAALEIVDDVREKVVSPELRASYLGSRQNYFDSYIDVLMRLHSSNPSNGYDSQAFEVSERARARGILDRLTEIGAEIRKGVDTALLARERDLQVRINGKAARKTLLLGGNYQPREVAVLDSELRELLRAERDLRAEIRSRSPRYAALQYPERLSAKQIQTDVLDPDTLLLEYRLGERRSYLWAVTSDSLRAFELAARSGLETLVRRATAVLSRPEPGYQAVVRELASVLLGPVRDLLPGKRLVIVADGALRSVPFAALPVRLDGGGSTREFPLVLAHEIVSVPSASMMKSLRGQIAGRTSAPGTIAVLADPVFDRDDIRVKRRQSSGRPSTSMFAAPAREFPARSGTEPIALRRLPFSRREAESIVALVPRGSALKAMDFAASREVATSPALGKHRLIHFATHAVLDDSHPELSGVVFSLVNEQGDPVDGFLRLHDTYNLDLPAELVVLSACQTAVGPDVTGDGLLGLTRGFMYAGAARVLASLWPADDKATAELMRRFYVAMLGKRKLPAAAALRHAQAQMSRHHLWKAPYYWAGFTLQGEWR
jgi:CHAT domain-containing protein